MKTILITIAIVFSGMLMQAQLISEDKIYLTFQDIEGEVNVNGENAIQMLSSYIVGKTTLRIVNSPDESNYTFVLSVIEKNMGKRKAKVDIISNYTQKVIFTSNWIKASSTAFYGYSGSRHAIGKIVKGPLLKEFPEIKM